MIFFGKTSTQFPDRPPVELSSALRSRYTALSDLSGTQRIRAERPQYGRADKASVRQSWAAWRDQP